MSDQLVHAISGAGGGALAAVVTYPLITLSTRAQTTIESQKSSIIEVIKRIIANEGVGSLYAGLDSALYGMTLTNFVYYYFYEGMKSKYLEAGGLSTVQSMVTGAYSGAATALLTNPIWVVNTRMMVNDKNILATVKDIIKNDGLTTFLSGLGPSLMLIANPVLNYSVFEQLRLALQRRRSVNSLDIFLLGAFSKIVATTITYPLITMKSRQQLGEVRGDVKSQNWLKYIVGMYNGWSMKILHSALQSACLFLFKEELFSMALYIVKLLRKLRFKRSFRII